MERKQSKRYGRWTEEQRQQLLAEWERSGKSQRDFCRERGLGLSTFGFWRRRRKRTAGLIEVRPVVTSQEAVTVALPSGLRVEAAPGVDCSWLGKLVSELVRCGA